MFPSRRFFTHSIVSKKFILNAVESPFTIFLSTKGIVILYTFLTMLLYQNWAVLLPSLLQTVFTILHYVNQGLAAKYPTRLNCACVMHHHAWCTLFTPSTPFEMISADFFSYVGSHYLCLVLTDYKVELRLHGVDPRDGSSHKRRV